MIVNCASLVWGGDSIFTAPSCLVLPKLLEPGLTTTQPFFQGITGLKFPVARLTKPFVIRGQDLKSADDLEFFMKHGFVSRLRLNVDAEKAKDLELKVASSKKLFREAMMAQKFGVGYGHAPIPFAAPFVEGTSELGFCAMANRSVEASVIVHKKLGTIIAKIKSRMGIPIAQFRGGVANEQEGGVMFLGQVPISEIEAFLHLKNDNGKAEWYLYQKDNGIWKSRIVGDRFYRNFINEALQTSEHVINRQNFERMVQSGEWLAPGN